MNKCFEILGTSFEMEMDEALELALRVEEDVLDVEKVEVGRAELLGDSKMLIFLGTLRIVEAV